MGPWQHWRAPRSDIASRVDAVGLAWMGKCIAAEMTPYRRLIGLGSRVASRTDLEPVENEDNPSSFTLVRIHTSVCRRDFLVRHALDSRAHALDRDRRSC